MSEPMIKPWSYKCFAGCEDVEANHLDGIDPRSVHHHSVDPLYTRDDLVRAVEEGFGVSSDGHKRSVAEEIVDWLTKGET